MKLGDGNFDDKIHREDFLEEFLIVSAACGFGLSTLGLPGLILVCYHLIMGLEFDFLDTNLFVNLIFLFLISSPFVCVFSAICLYRRVSVIPGLRYKKAYNGNSDDKFRYAEYLMYEGLIDVNIHSARSQACDGFEFYYEAAKEGHVLALFKTGCCFESGCGTPQDTERAKKCFEEAAKRGHKQAARRLVILENTMK